MKRPRLFLFWQRAQNSIRCRIVKRWGSAAVKQRVWDDEFARGQWDYLDSTSDDPLYKYLEEFAKGGDILDMGCGSGNTGNELRQSAYRTYTGVDISRVAIERAKARSGANGRLVKNDYECGDIEEYVPQRRYDVILFRESLFYVPPARITGVLDRYAGYLSDSGCVMVRLCSREKYNHIVVSIRSRYRLLCEAPLGAEKDGGIVLVFSGRPGRGD